jgi:hypothetical protein
MMDWKQDAPPVSVTPVKLPPDVEVTVPDEGTEEDIIAGTPEKLPPKPSKNRMSFLDSWSDDEADHCKGGINFYSQNINCDYYFLQSRQL